MSTSKGRGAAAHRIVEVVPPEQLRVPVPSAPAESGDRVRPRTGPTPIPRLFDEFDKFADGDRRPTGQGRDGAGLRIRLPLFAAGSRRRRGRRGCRVPPDVRPSRVARSRSRASISRARMADEKGSTLTTASAPSSRSGCWRPGTGSSPTLRIERGWPYETTPPEEAGGLDDDQRRFLGALAGTVATDAATDRRQPCRWRRLAVGHLRHGRWPGSPARQGVRGALRRVPWATERPTRGLAARRPRTAFVAQRLREIADPRATMDRAGGAA